MAIRLEPPGRLVRNPRHVLQSVAYCGCPDFLAAVAGGQTGRVEILQMLDLGPARIAVRRFYERPGFAAAHEAMKLTL